MFFFHYSSIHFRYLFLPRLEMTWLSEADKVGSYWSGILVRTEVCETGERVPLVSCNLPLQVPNTQRTTGYRLYQDLYCPKAVPWFLLYLYILASLGSKVSSFKCVVAYSNLYYGERESLFLHERFHISPSALVTVPFISAFLLLSLFEFNLKHNKWSENIKARRILTDYKPSPHHFTDHMAAFQRGEWICPKIHS